MKNYPSINPWFPLVLLMLLVGLLCKESSPMAMAKELNAWDISDGDEIKLSPVATRTFREIRVQVANGTDRSQDVSFGYGTYFKCSNDSFQSLAVVFPESVSVDAGQTETVVLKTTCMDASKAVPPNGHTGWTTSRDAALGDLFRFYAKSRPLVEAMTGPQHHDTAEKRHNFLQLLVWTYYGNDKKHMKSFVKKYMVNGDSKEADELVDKLYPVAKKVIDVYKQTNKGGLPIPQLPQLPF